MNLKRLFRAGCKYLESSDYRFLIHANLGFYDAMSDEEYLRRKFRACMGKELNLNNPQTFNEKLQWLKLYDRKPEYAIMADKYRMRQFVAERVGEDHTVPLIGVWDDPEDIDFDALPDQFVLKCNHNSGLGMCICKDKSKMDITKVKRELKRGLRQDYYLSGREYPYRHIPRKIIAEKFMKNGDADVLTDFKFFCFNGVPRIMYISKDNARVPETDFFDMEFNHLDLVTKDPNAKILPPRPEQFEEMKRIACLLSQNTAHLRVDFYVVKGHVYVGELTFFHNSGFSNIRPQEWALKLGSWIELPESEKKVPCK